MRFVIGILCSLAIAFARGQDAAQPNVDLGTHGEATPEPAVNPEDVPELSQLDEAFKQSSLGKEADEYRTRVAWRKLQNETGSDPEVVAAKRAADDAPTDLEKRHRLRDYYQIYYAKMRARADTPELRTSLEQFRDSHLRLLAQPRVRPNDLDGLPTPSATPEGKHKKEKKKGSKLSKFAPSH